MRPRSPSHDGRVGTTLGVRIKPETIFRMQEIAAERGKSMRKLAGEALEEFVERLESKEANTQMRQTKERK